MSRCTTRLLRCIDYDCSTHRDRGRKTVTRTGCQDKWKEHACLTAAMCSMTDCRLDSVPKFRTEAELECHSGRISVRM